MKIILREYGMTIVTLIIGMLILIAVPSIGTSVGSGVKNTVVRQDQIGKQKVSAITPKDDYEMPTSIYDTLTSWTGVSNSDGSLKVKYAPLEIQSSHTLNFRILSTGELEVKATEQMKSVTLQGEDLAQNTTVFQIPLKELKKVMYYELKITWNGNKTDTYVLNK